MKSLFNKYEAYNKVGGQVSDEMREAIKPIFEKWANKGYKIHDVEMIALDNITMESAILRATRAMKMRKEELKNANI